MNKENCALKLVDEIILYYDARSKKHQITQFCVTPYLAVRHYKFPADFSTEWSVIPRERTRLPSAWAHV